MQRLYFFKHIINRFTVKDVKKHVSYKILGKKVSNSRFRTHDLWFESKDNQNQ